MNEWDRDNLRFIMSSDYKTFKAWMEQATDDDIIIVRIYEYILLWHMYGLQLLFSIIIIMT